MIHPGTLPVIRRGGKSPKKYVVTNAQTYQSFVAHTRPEALRLLAKMPDVSRVHLSQLGEQLPGLWVKRGNELHELAAPRDNPALVTLAAGNPPKTIHDARRVPAHSTGRTIHDARRGSDSSVRSPTSTSTDVRSPTSTTTRARTEGNVTVTGGAGRGATTRVEIVKRNPPRKQARKDFQCMECGTRMTLKQAEKFECPKCGGSDIDVAPANNPPRHGDVELLSDRVLHIEYMHAAGGKRDRPYRHKFKAGVHLELLTDGSIRVYSKDGKPLYKWFD